MVLSLLRKNSFTIITSLAIVALATFLNQYFEYEVISKGRTSTEAYDVAYKGELKRNIVQAGWPVKYYLSIDYQEPRVPDLTAFSFPALLINVMTIGVALGAWIVFLKTRMPSMPENRRMRLGLIDLFAVVFIVALGLGVWKMHSQTAQRELEIANEIRRSGGEAHTKIIIPRSFSTFLPSWIPRSAWNG